MSDYLPQPWDADKRRRNARAYELYVQGFRGQAMADAMRASGYEVTGKWACQAARKLDKQIEARLLDEADRQKRLMLARLGNVYEEAARAWERSKAEKKKMRKRVTDPAPGAGPPGVKTETTQEIVQSPGDPRFLKAQIEALAAIRDLLGFGSKAGALAAVASGQAPVLQFVVHPPSPQALDPPLPKPPLFEIDPPPVDDFDIDLD